MYCIIYNTFILWDIVYYGIHGIEFHLNPNESTVVLGEINKYIDNYWWEKGDRGEREKENESVIVSE